MQPHATSDLDADYAPCYIGLARAATRARSSTVRIRPARSFYRPGSSLCSTGTSLATAIHSLEVLKDSGYLKYIAGKPFIVIRDSSSYQ